MMRNTLSKLQPARTINLHNPNIITIIGNNPIHDAGTVRRPHKGSNSLSQPQPTRTINLHNPNIITIIGNNPIGDTRTVRRPSGPPTVLRQEPTARTIRVHDPDIISCLRIQDLSHWGASVGCAVLNGAARLRAAGLRHLGGAIRV